MNDIKWKVLREDYLENLDLKVTLYAPTRCASTIRIESEKSESELSVAVDTKRMAFIF
jgi:hypothetical protein